MVWSFQKNSDFTLYLNDPTERKKTVEFYMHPSIAAKYSNGVGKKLVKRIEKNWPVRGARRWPAALRVFEEALMEEFKEYAERASMGDGTSTYIWLHKLFTSVYNDNPPPMAVFEKRYRHHAIIRYEKVPGSGEDSVYSGKIHAAANGLVVLQTRGSYRSFKLEKITEVSTVGMPTPLGIDFQKVNFVMESRNGVVNFYTEIVDLSAA